MPKILIIDDDPDLIQMISLKFRLDGYDVMSAISGWEGIKVAYDFHPDVVILDVMMPQMDGFETCDHLRRLTNVPVLILTARVAEDDVIRGLYHGADDYLTKPFSHKVLEARIQALLRRSKLEKQNNAKSTRYADEILSIDLNSLYMACLGRKERLTQTERQILETLIQNCGAIVTYQELMVMLWGSHDMSMKESLAVHVSGLRKKIRHLCDDHEYIQSQWGKGYVFVPRKQS